MSGLEQIPGGPDAAWYRVEDGSAHGVDRYVVSTAPGREIVNRPEIVGTAFTSRLGRAVATALRTAPFRALLEETEEERVHVLHVLRGGLSFGVREALEEAQGFTRHGSSFLSSQRTRDTEGRWSVHEDLYRKVQVPEGAVLLLGDVVATGTTLKHALELVGPAASHVVLFTIGGPQAESILASALPAGRTTVVYLEGRFSLAGERGQTAPGAEPPALAEPGTDLMRCGALLAPALRASQEEDAGRALERCAIYDAGSRAFDVPCYLEDVRGYWTGMRALADAGLTLAEALAQRWPSGHPHAGPTDASALTDVCNARLAALSSRATLVDAR